jgi:hypothetical protein
VGGATATGAGFDGVRRIPRRAAIAASVGLLVALWTVSPAPAGATAARADAADAQLSAARALVGHIPADQRYLCSIDDPESQDDLGPYLFAERSSLLVSLSCEAVPGIVTSFGYSTYTSPAAAERVFDAHVGTNRSSDCETPTSWRLNGKDVGRVACYETNVGGSSNGTFRYAVVVWTYRPLNLFAYALDDADNPDQLQRWWRSDAGPTATASRVAGLPDPVKEAGAARRLAAALPASTRRTCGQVPITPDSGPVTYRWRLWIAAELSCSPLQADSLIYDRVAPRALRPYFDFLYGNRVSDAETRAHVETSPPCPASFDYTTRKVKPPARPTGTYVCYVAAAPSTDGAVVAWTVDADHVLAVANRRDRDTSALVAVAEHAGPQPFAPFRFAGVLKPG